MRHRAGARFGRQLRDLDELGIVERYLRGIFIFIFRKAISVVGGAFDLIVLYLLVLRHRQHDVVALGQQLPGGGLVGANNADTVHRKNKHARLEPPLHVRRKTRPNRGDDNAISLL